MYNDNIHLKKRETITNGVKYDFFIYEILHLEKKHSDGKFGTGESLISKEKRFKIYDKEARKKLNVKFRCSKKLLDAMDGIEPKEAKKVFNKCLKELQKDGQITV
tara:strand:+ start:57 stop:371 length:315 start_codon:yes stop_codon:yes gene_type:complete